MAPSFTLLLIPVTQTLLITLTSPFPLSHLIHHWVLKVPPHWSGLTTILTHAIAVSCRHHCKSLLTSLHDSAPHPSIQSSLQQTLTITLWLKWFLRTLWRMSKMFNTAYMLCYNLVCVLITFSAFPSQHPTLLWLTIALIICVSLVLMCLYVWGRSLHSRPHSATHYLC